MAFLKKLFNHEYKELKRFEAIADQIEEKSEEYMNNYKLKLMSSVSC